jgi:N utilization substance protein A
VIPLHYGDNKPKYIRWAIFGALLVASVLLQNSVGGLLEFFGARVFLCIPFIVAIAMFEREVPEIKDGLVELKSISREAGSRTKIAVYSQDPDVDAQGSCIGPKGTRVQTIGDELNDEKIDIVKWSEDPAEFISAALSPSAVVSVEILSQQPKSCRVTVPDEQLSLAIGNKGQNARLAARLTGYNIDIHPESGYFGE